MAENAQPGNQPTAQPAPAEAGQSAAPGAPTTPLSSSAHWARTALWVAVAAIVTTGLVFMFKACLDAPAKTIEKAGTALEKLAVAFNHGKVTTEFISYATSLTNRLHLQVATLKQMEIFTRKEEKSTAFGYIPLPDVIVEARTPVEYNYYLDLNDPWKFVLEDNTVHVYAPNLKFTKPAVDVSTMTLEVKKGVFKAGETQEQLRKSISFLLQQRGRENVPLVRENARRQVENFVEGWLLKNFTDSKQYRLKVHFADEAVPPHQLPVAPPQSEVSLP